MSTESLIRFLPKQLVNRIAAGEVIERPASIVRELVENAIDAGGLTILIHAEQGGSVIQVRDDGVGMSEADLEICTERHATSKLPHSDVENINLLKHISTLGFRGEALTSMAAVARLSITSRTQDSEHGFQKRIDYGQEIDLKPSAAKQGTVVRVDDLFHTLPARRKFLKSDRYELSLIADVVKRLALAFPEIHFELSGISARPINYPSATEQDQRIKQIMGEVFMENALPVLAKYHEAKLAGWTSLPTYHRPNTQEQFFFVNQRPVRDRVLAGALRAAYADVIFRNRHPALVLFLTLPIGEVDINVHPAKAEVRFRDAASVRLLVIGALKKALANAGHKAATPHSHQALEVMAQNRYVAPPPPAISSEQSLDLPQALPAEIAPEPQPFPATSSTGFAERIERIERIAEEVAEYPLGVARGQLHNTYIVSQNQDAIIIIDQHAAHERIVHEKLKAAFKNKDMDRQRLLVPEIIKLAADQIEYLMAQSENIAKLGFILERYGDDAILVREIPTLCKGSDLKEIIEMMANDFAEGEHSSSIEEKFDKISGNIACHSSMRAGRKLSLPEMNALLRQIETTPHAGQCNHGRPTYIEMKLKDIEKLFHRR